MVERNTKIKVYEELGKLRVEQDVELEIKSYYCDREAPAIVWATGLGGAAGVCPFFEDLAKTYRIVSFSPRNCAGSNGSLTLDNYISDIKKIVDSIFQENGRIPYGMGHSMGGYSFGHLLGESPLVKKAVLLAPLVQMDEQMPPLFDDYLRWCARNNKIYFAETLSKVLQRSEEKGVALDKQRFGSGEVIPFLRSVYEFFPCNRRLLSPTKVILSGGTCFRFPISQRRLEKLTQSWKDIGAEVDVYPHLNHWFSGTRWFSGVGEFCGLCKKEGITKDIESFFR